MVARKLNNRISLVARVLFSHLLLMYLIWFPLHLQTHAPHTFTQTAQQKDEGSIPVEEEACQICDWWAHQSSIEGFAPAALILTCIELAYHLPIYALPYVEGSAQLSPRAPPALG